MIVGRCGWREEEGREGRGEEEGGSNLIQRRTREGGAGGQREGGSDPDRDPASTSVQ